MILRATSTLNTTAAQSRGLLYNGTGPLVGQGRQAVHEILQLAIRLGLVNRLTISTVPQVSKSDQNALNMVAA